PARLQDLVEGRHRLLEFLEGLEVGEVDLYGDDDLHSPALGCRVDPGVVAEDHALLLQPPDPAQARRRCQADPASELDVAEAAVSPKMKQNCSVYLIKLPFVAH